MYSLPYFVPLFRGCRDKVVKLLVLFFQHHSHHSRERGWNWKQKVCHFCLALFRENVPGQPDGASPAATTSCSFSCSSELQFLRFRVERQWWWAHDTTLRKRKGIKRDNSSVRAELRGASNTDVELLTLQGSEWSWTSEMEWSGGAAQMIQLPGGFVGLSLMLFSHWGEWGGIKLWKLSFTFTLLLFSWVSLTPVQGQPPACLCLGNNVTYCLWETFLFVCWWFFVSKHLVSFVHSLSLRLWLLWF